MKPAVFYGGPDIRLEERAEPTPGRDEVRVRAAGICGSDLRPFDRSIQSSLLALAPLDYRGPGRSHAGCASGRPRRAVLTSSGYEGDRGKVHG